jgi:prepilin-type N-terminal cleavage/methylation domain-containing protein
MFCKLRSKILPSSDRGFTIIESLIAIVVVSILLAAIAPVLVLATANRVQARRIEKATQAAKTFMDSVRNGTIAATNISVVSTLADATSAAPRVLSSTTTSAYLITSQTMPAPTTFNGLFCFNSNGQISLPDCTSNLYYIQAGRIVKTTNPTDGYRLAIRIYRADGTASSLQVSDGTSFNQASFTGTFGNKQAPLISMTTDISTVNLSDRSQDTSFKSLCQRLGVQASNTTCN